MMNSAAITQSIISGNMTNSDLDTIVDAIKFARQQIIRKNTGSLIIGTAVKFTSTRSGKLITGTVSKVNRKFIIVDSGAGSWRVPANMLIPA